MGFTVRISWDQPGSAGGISQKRAAEERRPNTTTESHVGGGGTSREQEGQEKSNAGARLTAMTLGEQSLSPSRSNPRNSIL